MACLICVQIDQKKRWIIRNLLYVINIYPYHDLYNRDGARKWVELARILKKAGGNWYNELLLHLVINQLISLWLLIS